MTTTTVLRKLKSASRLSVEEWMLFLQAWTLLLIFDVSLRTCPFPKLQKFATRLSQRPSQKPEQVEHIIRILITSVDRARNHHIYPMTCLRRSLALQKMLVQRGIVAQLKIGVCKETDILSAHAWLEYCGKPLGESEYIRQKFSVMKKEPPDLIENDNKLMQKERLLYR